MFLTQKNAIRGLSVQEFNALRKLCRLSKTMFNVGLYAVRQHYLAQRSHLAYESVYHQTKTNDNYKLLSTDIAQQTLKVVDRSFQSFVQLTEAVCMRLYCQKVNMPYYLPKQGYFMLIIPRIRVKDGFFNVPMSPRFRKNYGEVRISFPERLVGKTLKEVRIIPRYLARYFEVEFIIEEKATPVPLDPNKALSIDPGLDNLATCVDTSGTSFIVDGKYLKSINQWFNKENARLQSINDKQGYKHLTERQVRVARARNKRVRDYLNKTA